MTHFVGFDGQRLNLDRVRKVELFVSGGATVTYENGDKEEDDAVERWLIAGLKDAARPPRCDDIIPAAPGFEIVGFWPPAAADSDTFDIASALYRTPVIAWKIDASGEDNADQIAIGLSLNSDYHHVDDTSWVTVLAPNGHVRSYWDEQTHDTFEEWVSWVRGEWKEKKRRATLKVVGAEEGGAA